MGSLAATAVATAVTPDWITDAVDDLSSSFLITDPALPNHPIVFASRGFLALSGYSAAEVLGRNGRIFQGPATDRRTVMLIREAIREEREIQISILNYRKDGSPHWLLFHLCPVFAADDGRVVYFVAVQVPIPCRAAPAALIGTCRVEVEVAAIDPRKRGVEVEETREAGDWERQKAASAAEDVVLALARYSKFTDRLVCRRRCCAAPVPAQLSSSVTISLGRIKQSFVLTDPHLPDMPIVYASEDFLRLTEGDLGAMIRVLACDLEVTGSNPESGNCLLASRGYSSHEVLGRNCRFLNGLDTDSKVLNHIRNSIRAQQACSIRLLNYRKDGSSFWNLLHISPVRNASGKIAFYVGVQMDEGSGPDRYGLSPEMRQLGAVGAVKVAVRSLSACIGPSRTQ